MLGKYFIEQMNIITLSYNLNFFGYKFKFYWIKCEINEEFC